jgi:nucleotide-binding universal stress UspA family protein
MFRGVSVLLDEATAERGALAQASECAARFRLPLHAVELPSLASNSSLPEAVAARLRGFASGVSEAAREALAAACERGRISWDAVGWRGSSRSGSEQFFRPGELCVFANSLPAAFKDILLSCLARRPWTTALICPREWRPVSRVLVLNPEARPSDGFLDAAAAVCLAFQAAPVLLTTGRSESEARSRERFAEEALARRRLTVDCDIAAGCGAATAVLHAARWRRCSHVIVERRSISRWRRWLGGDLIRELAAIPDCPALIAVAGTAIPPHPLEGTQQAVPANYAE